MRCTSTYLGNGGRSGRRRMEVLLAKGMNGGRYVFNISIFDILLKTKQGKELVFGLAIKVDIPRLNPFFHFNFSDIKGAAMMG